MNKIAFEVKELKHLLQLLEKYPEAKITNLIGDKDVWRVEIEMDV